MAAPDSEDMEGAASRLEAALERIARAGTVRASPATQRGDMLPEQAKARLDSLIGRLRFALGDWSDE